MMHWLKSIITQSRENNVTSQDAAWYVAANEKKSVRQVILEIQPTSLVNSRFSTLMFGPKYASLISSDWAMGFFRMSDDPGPFLLVRARGEHSVVSSRLTRLAFAFYRMRKAGIISTFWDCPDTAGRWPYGHVEGASSADQPLGVEIIRDAMRKDRLQITFAVNSASTSNFGTLPLAVSDIDCELPEAFRKSVLEELDALCIYQRGLSGRENGNDAMQQMWAENPPDRSAIIERPK